MTKEEAERLLTNRQWSQRNPNQELAIGITNEGPTVCIDGCFTKEQLTALLVLMDHHPLQGNGRLLADRRAKMIQDIATTSSEVENVHVLVWSQADKALLQAMLIERGTSVEKNDIKFYTLEKLAPMFDPINWHTYRMNGRSGYQTVFVDYPVYVHRFGKVISELLYHGPITHPIV